MKFVTDKSSLTIELHGSEQIWALKAKLVVSRADIKNIEFKETFKDWRKWEVRLPGTGLPGKLIAGSFWTEEGWDFLYLSNPHGWFRPFAHNVLYIETNQHKYSRIILSCSQQDARYVIQWAKK